MVKISKIILITLLIAIILFASGSVYALTDEQIEKFNPKKDPIKDGDWDAFAKKAGIVLGFVRNIGAIVSVLGIAVLGLRYMWGSLEQKANYKETMFPFIIGIAMTVGVTVIITIVQSVAEKI
ncbi:MAG: hypothetical protein IKT41_00585 [Clostridia bacterium]|nr:hypothetical protein [Clostridia bacterium]